MGAQGHSLLKLVPFLLRPSRRGAFHLRIMNVLKGAVDGAKKPILEKAIQEAEEQAGNMAPGPVKMFFPCCGGPVLTLKKFECAVPADKKDEFAKAYDSYNKAQDELKSM